MIRNDFSVLSVADLIPYPSTFPLKYDYLHIQS